MTLGRLAVRRRWLRHSLWLLVMLLGGGVEGGTAEAQPAPASAAAVTTPGPAHGFVQAGTGFYEILHVEVGGFLGPHLSVEGMVASAAVFGARYGAGLMFLVGRDQEGRPPRHALLLGARLMLNSDASFDTHGDDLSSYCVLPVGYSFLADGGFFLRVTAGMAILRDRITTAGAGPGAAATTHHEVGLAGPMLNIGLGVAFSGDAL